MRLVFILLGDMKQEAFRQLLRWDGREIRSGKKKGECFSPQKMLAPPIGYIILYNSPVSLIEFQQSVLVFALVYLITMAHLSSSLCSFVVLTSDGRISAAV